MVNRQIHRSIHGKISTGRFVVRNSTGRFVVGNSTGRFVVRISTGRFVVESIAQDHVRRKTQNKKMKLVLRVTLPGNENCTKKRHSQNMRKRVSWARASPNQQHTMFIAQAQASIIMET